MNDWRKFIDKKDVALCQHAKWSQEHGYSVEKNGKCEGYVKPDIVFFGEDLPMRFGQLRLKDFQEKEDPCDCLLVLGTSLAVAPFNTLVSNAESNVPRVLINNEKVGVRSNLYGGFEFDHKDNYRDLFLEGSCDDTVLEICKELGWEKELLPSSAIVSIKMAGISSLRGNPRAATN